MIEDNGETLCNTEPLNSGVPPSRIAVLVSHALIMA